ncbi:MAG: flagellar hook protein FliD, partial [Gammaproteobacteria bacterium]|nr:flagellar hook protein FliD [Gammaproteobacteria bacterium]NIR97725.1 flagellar hook protein FliD [Gammaproteobacteria bacterium]NIT63957.1 flagellar hook protein FliD [Gammaproteobacteria bacterium]NIV20361.1 flagellar hook protein FliD [Gammaproteobacteria bacterium]NIY32537.1 flagellar hook protein FliD [Gammaproteobacteria bacterium]
EEVVTATSTNGAKPGKHTLTVERLALNHQIASQGFEAEDAVVGTGRFTITVGEEGSPINVTVDESTNTLAGLKSAINFATDAVNA